jgi:hypothetical protein
MSCQTNWDGINVFEDMIYSQDSNGRELLLEFVAALFDEGLLTGHCLHWLCEGKYDSSKIIDSWELLHQFVTDNKLQEIASPLDKH